MRKRRPWLFVLGGVGAVAVLATALAAQSSSSDEEVARLQLESGRKFAREGNYVEALKDFKAVADVHPTSSSADNALLEIARYYLDVVSDEKQAAVAVDAILKKYATSDSAPDAYVMAGRLALAHSHQAGDLETAIANFDRVFRLFPTSDAVPRSLRLLGDTLWFGNRLDEALAALGRVDLEYPTSISAAEAHLSAGRVLVSLGDPISAMDELQQVRNRWPNTPEAATALSRITLLHRLYVRAKGGAAYVLSADTPGPAKLESAVALAASAGDRVYWASETSVGIATAAGGPALPPVTKPRGLTLDTAGNLIIVDSGVLRTLAGGTILLMLPKSDGTQEPLSKPDAVVQLSNGDWLVMDGNGKNIHRYNRTGNYLGPFALSHASRLAVNSIDEVASIDKDQKAVVLFDASGKITGKIAFKGTGYDLQNPEDLSYDAFGHLYVLDRGAIAVFSPYPAAPVAAPAAAPAAAAPAAPAGAAAARTYRLVTLFSESEKSTTGFHKGTSFALNQAGMIYLYDENAKRIMVYR